MFGYYLDLAVRSLKRNVALTVLMIVAIAFGIGASMTTLTVMHVLSADPLPGKSDDVYYVQLDPYPARTQDPDDEPAFQLTRQDAENLLRLAKADRQVMMTGGAAAVEPQRAGLEPFFVDGRWTSADFFAMFRVPFIAGSGWTGADDAAHARVVVISRPLAEKVFGTTDVVGKQLRVGGNDMRVGGVIEHWVPTPHFFDLTTGAYGAVEQLFLPFSTAMELDMGRNGSMDCWKRHDGDPKALGAPCTWIQFWVELHGADAAARYEDFLVHYSLEQKAAGRFEREPNVRMYSVMDWLDKQDVVPKDARLQMWIALGFLVVCLLNTIGLLLTKFLRRSSEIGVRRALGASKRAIFVQLLIESGVIGLAGGALGLGLAWLGLWAVRHQMGGNADFIHLDAAMLAATFALAVTSSVLAGLLPAWRGCQITPAVQLKSH